jgi:hypothetical protein
LTSVRKTFAAAIALSAVLALSACGSSEKKSESSGAGKTGTAGANVDVTVTDSGKTIKYGVPKSVKGGLTTLTVSNKAKAPHGAQLVLIKGDHTPQEALKVIGGKSNKTPEWLRAEGGIGQVAPGKTADASLVLDPGKYMVIDAGPQSGEPPAYSQFTVAGKNPGSLPTSSTTVTAANPGKDKYRWDISGQLKTGPQQVTFVSKGKEALHLIGAFRLNGNASKADVIKGLGSQGKPPKFVDQSSFYTTAVMDGGKSQVTPLTLKSPGKWVLFCPITDREGGKEHFKEGMVQIVDVK